MTTRTSLTTTNRAVAPDAPAIPRMLVAYADGACDVNPGGTATYGVVVYDEQGQELAAECGIVAEGPGATNNVAEYAAAHRALALVRAMALPRGSHLTLHGDSRLWVRMLNGQGQPQTPTAPYVPYYQQARAALRGLRTAGITVVIEWIPRERNTRADALSKQAGPTQARGASPDPGASQAVLPFGRHRGRALSAIPTPYLRWLLEQRWLSPWLHDRVLAEVEARVLSGRLAPEPAR